MTIHAKVIPEGFEPLPASSPFVTLMGTLYFRAKDNGIRVLALEVVNDHMNMHANAHGGMLATLADSALGYNISRMAKRGVVTAQMNLEFLSAVQEGDWLEAHVTMDKQGSRLIFASCDLLVGERRVLKTTAIFAVRRQDGSPQQSDG